MASLRLDSKGLPSNAWDNKPELAARAVAGDLESLLDHEDTVSVSTIRTVEPMIYCSPTRTGFSEMGRFFNIELFDILKILFSFLSFGYVIAVKC